MKKILYNSKILEEKNKIIQRKKHIMKIIIGKEIKFLQT
jgi:hypothetical protein